MGKLNINGYWRRKDEVSYFHFFKIGTYAKSLCGLPYPHLGQGTPKPTQWQKCKSCEKMRQGFASSTKGVAV